ncbi:hypothetical protein [Alistipes sp.]|uniref:hypothetical protein n=1 Tax=Alistipes sp. TaxID=1872444 RepID=UPI003AF000D9
MKKLVRTLTLALGASVLLASCGSVTGSGPKMDTEEATALVAETVKKNIDLSQWKIYRVLWMEAEKLENELLSVTVEMVNPAGDCFSQTFTLSGLAKGKVSDLNQVNTRSRVDFSKVTGIDPQSIDPAAVQRQYEAAKKSIPEGYTFQSIADYDIRETMSSGDAFFDRGKNIGEIRTRFVVNLTENGKEVIESAGKKSIQYYEMAFNVLPDGSIELDE